MFGGIVGLILLACLWLWFGHLCETGEANPITIVKTKVWPVLVFTSLLILLVVSIAVGITGFVSLAATPGAFMAAMIGGILGYTVVYVICSRR